MVALVLAGCAGSAPPNVVVVSLDALRADRLGAYGGERGLTPNLDRFAGEAVVFTRAYAQSTATGPSHASLLTGRYPPEIGGDGPTPEVGERTPTLAERLGEHGYTTAAHVGGGDLNEAVGPTRGFGDYVSSADFGALWHTVPTAVDWLDASEEPFFLLLHGYDAHAPYLSPTPWGLLHTDGGVLTPAQQAVASDSEHVVDGRLHPTMDLLDTVTRSFLHPRGGKARARLAAMVEAAPRPFPEVSSEDQARIRDLYDGAVSYADAWFGVFMARLAEEGRLDDTVVVVLGDHGEALGEEGLFHRCCSLEDEVTHVPLMVRVPGRAAGRVDAVVELTDVMPTVLELAGVDVPEGVHGRSLVPALRGEPFPGRRAAVSLSGFNLRMVSARSAAGRLTWTGPQADFAVQADMLDAARVGGPSFRVTGDVDAGEQAALQAELMAWTRELRVAPSRATLPVPEELR